MTDLRTAAEMALSTLIKSQPLTHTSDSIQELMETIRMLRQALAQPEHRFDTPKSHILTWTIPGDPDNFGEPLAQPEQEPVCDKDPSLCGFTLCQLAKVCKHTPINTMPTKIFALNFEQILNAAGFYRREWVGLTSEDWENTPDTGKQGCERDVEIFDWIEQTLKEKNT